MKGKKTIMVLTLCIMLLGSTVLPSYALTLTVNGRQISCYAEDGITYAPVRSFADSYGYYDVVWDKSTESAEVTGQGLDMNVYMDKHYTVANDRVLMRAAPNRTFAGRIFAPVTVLGEAIGANVSWSRADDRVTVTGGGAPLEHGNSYYNAEDLYWLARIINAESRGEPYIGKCAVGNVVLNRTTSRSFPDTVKDVVFDTKFGVQFSPILDGSINLEPKTESILAAKACLDGFTLSEDVLYFLNPRAATNSWIINNRPYAFGIGNHDFYY